MKKYSNLVYKQFKINKKRNILTMMAITLGIVLFTTTASLGKFILNVDNEKRIVLNGDYEIFANVDNKDVNRIVNNTLFSHVGSVQFKGIHNFTIEGHNRTLDLHLYGLDKISINKIFFKSIILLQGRMPEDNKEVILPNSVLKTIGITIGDNINISEESYTVVGTYKDDNKNISFQGFYGITFLDSKDIINETRSLLIKIKDGATVDLDKYNSNYIHGNTNEMVEEKITIAIINLSILIIIVITIYGSVTLSIYERMKFWGILRCIGSRKDRISYLLIKEIIILSIISIIIGIIIGYVLTLGIIDIVLANIMKMELYNIKLEVYPEVIVTVVLLAFITILLAVRKPISRLNSMEPIDILKSKFRNKVGIRKDNRLIEIILGYKGKLACKCLKANKKYYYINTITMIILLLVFVGFTGYYKAIISINDEVYNRNYKDIRIDFFEEENKPLNDIFNIERKKKKDISNIVGVKEVNSIVTLNNLNGKLSDGKIVDVQIHIYDNELIKNNNENIFVVNNYYFKERKIKTSDEISIETNKGSQIIFKLTNVIDNYDNNQKDRLVIFVSKNIFDKELEEKVSANISILGNYVKGDYIEETRADIEAYVKLQNAIYNDNLYYNTSMKRDINGVAVIVYIGLVLIMVIGSINIINGRIIKNWKEKNYFYIMKKIGVKSKILKKIMLLQELIQLGIVALFGGVLGICILNIVYLMFSLINNKIYYKPPYNSIVIGIIILVIIDLLGVWISFEKYK